MLFAGFGLVQLILTINSLTGANTVSATSVERRGQCINITAMHAKDKLFLFNHNLGLGIEQ